METTNDGDNTGDDLEDASADDSQAEVAEASGAVEEGWLEEARQVAQGIRWQQIQAKQTLSWRRR